jgi:hypothetical protein
MDILLARYVPDDAKGTRLLARDALHGVAVPRDEGDDRTPFRQLAHQRQPKTRRSSRNRDAQPLLMFCRHVTRPSRS